MNRGLAIDVWPENFHHRFGPAEFAKTKLAVEAVSVAGSQTETTQSLQSRMAHHAFHKPLSQTFAAIIFEDVDIAEISVGGGVCDDARETDLSFPVKQREAERIGDGTLHRFAWNSFAPIGANEIGMNCVEIKLCGVSGD